ncbi:phage minor tail protein L [Xenorhabdus khoisanae]|uniref:Phage minor tail protein L n=1 Tax=Xenorhabdus khoisanae TaxID=880157 RepID=A0A0J5FNY7_9GAMM|nr:phage minor tail protein L [Xenorhabdus khoisanae]KMJ43677.1 phage minor tail protein L [Xenorhabdus khoisanae]
MFSADIQKLAPGKTVRLYEVDGTAFGADVLRFHAYGIPLTPDEIEAAKNNPDKFKPKSIWWQGREYGAWPVKIEGLDLSSDGKSARPKLTVTNINGLITALCLQFEDMVQAKVTIHDTFVHYLDAVNFPEGNPTADPEQERTQTFYVDRKEVETDKEVTFELASPADLEGLRIPTRQIHSLCTWCSRGWYRTGKGCDYAGSRYFDENDNPVDDPGKDKCGGLLRSCKLRFGEDEPLPFGGYPGAALIRR